MILVIKALNVNLYKDVVYSIRRYLVITLQCYVVMENLSVSFCWLVKTDFYSL